eukprot:4179833-Amphidinium_carterae.1
MHTKRSWHNLFALARKIVTKKAIENAVSVVYAVGGSTNAVLHLLAIAHEAGIPKEDFNIETLHTVGQRVPLLANVSPHGRYHMHDVDQVLEKCHFSTDFIRMLELLTLTNNNNYIT